MTNYYYSGQGSLLVGARTVAGKPAGLIPVGNVPELTIDIATTLFEHKESESGDRLTDLTINKENKGTFAFKLENLSLDNLALGLYGTSIIVPTASVTNEIVGVYAGLKSPLNFPDVSAVTVEATDGLAATSFPATTAVTLGQYIKPAASPLRYYKVTVAGTTGGTEPTWPTNGGTVVSGTATLQDMGTVIKVAGTDFVLDAKFGTIEGIALAAGVGFESGRNATVDYTYAGSSKMDAFTVPAPERWLRFQGLNTVDGSSIIVDIFKAKFDPLTGYGLIVEDIAAVDMKGTILADALQVTGSKYFRQWNLSA